MWFDIKLAFRFIFFRQKGFYRVARFFTIGTIAVSVGALLVSLSAFRGYIKILSKRYLDSSSHIIVSDQNLEINSLKDDVVKFARGTIKDAKYFGYLELIAASSSGLRGVVFEVLEKGAFDSVVRIEEYMKEGKPDCIYKSNGAVIIGSAISDILSLKVGDTFKVLYAGSNSGRSASEVTVCGIVNFGLYDLDSRFAYTSIDTASVLFPNADFHSSLKVRLKNDSDLEDTFLLLRAGFLPGVRIRTWKDINFSMFEAVKLDRFVIFFILSILIAVSVFNIITTLILLTRELRIDISVLQVMGIGIKRFLRIFFIKSLMLGVTGYAAGLVLWGLVVFIVGRWGVVVLPEDVYLVSKIPVESGWGELFLVLFVVVFFVCVSSLFPLFSLLKKLKREGVVYGIKGYGA
ncbi:MAG: ABC transporter permease [Oligoflexia bacterium]|nr:ABC transporter permease [Oligoflexia bacterium]